MSGAKLPAARSEPVTVLLPDQIDIANASEAGLDLASAPWAGPKAVIADLTGTRFFGAADAGMLAAAHRTAVAAGDELRIATSPPVRRVLTLTRLDRVLNVYRALTTARAGEHPARPRCGVTSAPRPGPARPHEPRGRTRPCPCRLRM